MRGERDTISFYADFFIWTPPRAAPPPQTTGLASASSENWLASSKSKSQLLLFFQIPKIHSASGNDVIHVLDLISYLGFLLWHLWLSHPPRARVNTCAQCVHLTNPCTKRKVLGLTKPKGKIYKTKSLHNYITLYSLMISAKLIWYLQSGILTLKYFSGSIFSSF